MNIIETNNLTRRFGRTEAVHELSLAVPTGSVFALLGSNGAGKTTTIKLLMNLLAPTAGAAQAFELLALHAVVSVPAALVAVVTDTLGRFLIWSFVLLFSMATIPGMTAFAMSNRMSDASLPAFVIAGWSTFVLTVAIVIVRQFLRRDVVRSLAWLGAGAVISPLVAITVASGWFRFASPGPSWTDWHADRASGVTLSVHSFGENGGDKSNDGAGLNTLFEVKGLPRELALDGGASASQTWRWPGGPVVTRNAFYLEASSEARGVRAALGLADRKRDEETAKYFADRDAERVAKWLAAHPERSAPPPMPPVIAQVGALVFPSTIKRIERTPPAYEASVQLRLLRPELWLEVPLKNNGWHAHSAHGFRLGQPMLFKSTHIFVGEASDTAVANEAVVPLVATMPDFFWDALSNSYNSFRDDWRGAGLYLVNRAGGAVERKFIRTEPSLTIGSVKIMSLEIGARQASVRRGEKWVAGDQNWLAGATVALMGFREEARFTAEVKADRYEAAK